MILNNATPRMEVNPETYEVRADGRLLTCSRQKYWPWLNDTSCFYDLLILTLSRSSRFCSSHPPGIGQRKTRQDRSLSTLTRVIDAAFA